MDMNSKSPILKLKDIADLIKVRQYVNASIETYTLDKKVIRQLQSMLLLLDKRITSELLSDSFKAFIDFDNAQAAVREAAAITNIKTGMKPVQTPTAVVHDGEKATVIRESK